MRLIRFIGAVAGAFALASACAAQDEGAATDDARLNPNSASEADLAALEAVSDELAAEIVTARPFDTILAFDAFLADNLDEEARGALYPELFVPVELNTASREEIMLVPGMSRRMAHEFEEYRPYTDMEQFDREIGKYVDEAEVARLASYTRLEVE